jgi:LuxR family maltose regulon positive regulatory protein
VGVVLADLPTALRLSALAVHEEDDDTVAGYVVARTIHGAMLTFSGAHDEAIPWLDDAWEHAGALGLPPLLGLQAASVLALALVEAGAHDRLRRLFARVGPDVRTAEERWGGSTAPGLARLRTVEGRLARIDGDVAGARDLLRRAVELAQTFGEVPALVTALFELAEVELAAGATAAARTATARARDVLDHEPVPQLYADRLASVERRLGRAPRTSTVRHGDVPVEELTDRERAVLRALTGDASQREIGAALYLSVNTVKGYTKVLYRKLGVSTRHEAVTRARALGLL